jgi:hypothetical protein
MALEVGMCEILFPYWLAKINVMEKSAKLLHCPHSQSSKELYAYL